MDDGKRSRLRLALVGLALAVAIVGCDRLGIGVTPIGDIQKNAAAFQGKDVILRGQVIESSKIPLLNVTIYSLRDDTGQITVTTSQDRPLVGRTVTVHGRVENAAIVGGRGFGVTVAEHERR